MEKAITEHFGDGRQGAPSPMARLSQIFDVLNNLTIDAIIKPKHIGERELAARHMVNVVSGDLILLDRGYPAWWMFKLILTMNANFCARISCTKWKAVRKFSRSGLPEKVIKLPVNHSSVAQCNQMGLDTNPIKLRLIRIENDGKVAVLIQAVGSSSPPISKNMRDSLTNLVFIFHIPMVDL